METPQNKHKKKESSFEEWLDITIEETYNKGYSEGFKAGREEVLKQLHISALSPEEQKLADLIGKELKLSLSNNPQDE